MTMQVRYLKAEDIEAQALGLLREYGAARNWRLSAPVPVDDILDSYLKLALVFDDLRKLLRIDDVLGAINVPDREVYIDQSLDPTEFPVQEGRYHFTCAHEAGHWVLHRHHVIDNPTQLAWDLGNERRANIICRSSQADERIEWQADRFAAAFVMPESLVRNAWKDLLGYSEPFIIREPPQDAVDVAQRWIGTPRNSRWRAKDADPVVLAKNQMAGRFARRFKVSTQAMRIRLEHLRLLVTEQPGGIFSRTGGA